MVTQSVLPTFPVFDSVDGMDYAARRVLDGLDFSKLDNWWNPEECAEEVIGPMLRFLEVGPLDTNIFGVRYRRDVYANAALFREFRGSDHAIRAFNGLLGLRTSYALTPDMGIPTGIVFTVSPPVGRIPDSDWQGFLRGAYRWLLPPYLAIENFVVGLDFRHTHYHVGEFKLRHRIK